MILLIEILDGEKMKKIIKSGLTAILLIIISLSCSTEHNFKGSFYHSPQNAQPGGEIEIKYNADSSSLAGMSDIGMIAYLYNDNLYKTTDVPLGKDGNIYTGKIKTDENTLGVLFKFVSGNDIDNNNGSGYVIFLSDENGTRIPGSLAGYGVAINRWGAYYLDLDRDKEKAFKYLKEDFDKNPKIKNRFFNSYFEVLSVVKPEKRDKIIKEELDILAETNPLDEERLLVLNDWYEDIGEKNKADFYGNILLEKFPHGKFVENLKIKEFKKEKNAEKKSELAENFEKEFPESEYIQYMYDVTANVYRDNREYEKALDFLSNNRDKTSTYRFYSIVKRMLDEDADMNTALAISELGVERSDKELKNPTDKKPDYLSESEWQKEREYYAGLNYFVKGKVLYQLNRREEALTVLEQAVDLSEKKDELINELYAKTLIENGKYDFAMSKISGFIESGYGTLQMKSYLKEAYLNEKGTESGFDEYAAQFENAAQELLIKRLRNEMILESAPQFTLNDLSGLSVSLDEYKGKTVILDFWATWCAPCRESFPAMKKSIEKYSDDDNVKFLFINSWERTSDKLKNASEFITKNDYPFHVLLDEKNKVIEKYKVSGVPTKFIIDPAGNIRFKTVGFEGSDDRLVEEISTMISMIN